MDSQPWGKSLQRKGSSNRREGTGSQPAAVNQADRCTQKRSTPAPSGSTLTAPPPVRETRPSATKPATVCGSLDRPLVGRPSVVLRVARRVCIAPANIECAQAFQAAFGLQTHARLQKHESSKRTCGRMGGHSGPGRGGETSRLPAQRERERETHTHTHAGTEEKKDAGAAPPLGDCVWMFAVTRPAPRGPLPGCEPPRPRSVRPAAAAA